MLRHNYFRPTTHVPYWSTAFLTTNVSLYSHPSNIRSTAINNYTSANINRTTSCLRHVHEQSGTRKSFICPRFNTGIGSETVRVFGASGLSRRQRSISHQRTETTPRWH